MALRFVFLTQQQRLNCVDSTLSSVRALRLPLPGCLWTVPNSTYSLMMLFFVQLLFRKSVKNCRAFIHFVVMTERRQSWYIMLFDTAPKFAIFSVSGCERRKVDKQANLHENKHVRTLESFEYFCQISPKSILVLLSYVADEWRNFITPFANATLPPPPLNRNH